MSDIKIEIGLDSTGVKSGVKDIEAALGGISTKLSNLNKAYTKVNSEGTTKASKKIKEQLTNQQKVEKELARISAKHTLDLGVAQQYQKINLNNKTKELGVTKQLAAEKKKEMTAANQLAKIKEKEEKTAFKMLTHSDNLNNSLDAKYQSARNALSATPSSKVNNSLSRQYGAGQNEFALKTAVSKLREKYEKEDTSGAVSAAKIKQSILTQSTKAQEKIDKDSIASKIKLATTGATAQIKVEADTRRQLASVISQSTKAQYAKEKEDFNEHQKWLNNRTPRTASRNGGKTQSGQSGIFREIAASTRLIEGPLGGVAGRISALDSVFNNTSASAIAFGAALTGAGFAIGSLISKGDEMERLANKLRVVSKEGDNLEATENSLFDISQKTRASYAATVDIFARYKRTIGGLGATQQQLTQLTETTNMAVALSGTTAASAEAALFQLSQGLAAGAIRGQEFNSISEQTSRITTAVAEGLGKTIGQLRVMANEGKLTADKFMEGMKNSAGTIRTEFAASNITVEQATTKMSNAFNNYIKDANRAGGYTSSLAKGIEYLSSNFSGLASTAKVVAGALVAGATYASAISLLSTLGGVVTSTGSKYEILAARVGASKAAMLLGDRAIGSTIASLAALIPTLIATAAAYVYLNNAKLRESNAQADVDNAKERFGGKYNKLLEEAAALDGNKAISKQKEAITALDNSYKELGTTISQAQARKAAFEKPTMSIRGASGTAGTKKQIEDEGKMIDIYFKQQKQMEADKILTQRGLGTYTNGLKDSGVPIKDKSAAKAESAKASIRERLSDLSLSYKEKLGDAGGNTAAENDMLKLNRLIADNQKEYNLLGDEGKKAVAGIREQITLLGEQDMLRPLNEYIARAGDLKANMMDTFIEFADRVPDLITAPFEQGETAISRFRQFGADMMRQFANDVIKQLMSIAIAKAIAGVFGGPAGAAASWVNPDTVISPMKFGAVTPSAGFARGGAFSGMIGGPTTFAVSNSQMGIAGEGGRKEAIMPLTRDSGGNMGVRMIGGSGASSSSGAVSNVFAPQINITTQGGATQVDEKNAAMMANMVDKIVTQKMYDFQRTQSRAGGMNNSRATV